MSKHVNKVTAAGLIVALGIIYGDIGTSPLYVFSEMINGKKIEPDLIIGGLSCIIWTLTLQTTIKYVLLTLKADNRGEGGIFSLYTLVRRQKKWLVHELPQCWRARQYRATADSRNLDFLDNRAYGVGLPAGRVQLAVSGQQQRWQHEGADSCWGEKFVAQCRPVCLAIDQRYGGGVCGSSRRHDACADTDTTVWPKRSIRWHADPMARTV